MTDTDSLLTFVLIHLFIQLFIQKGPYFHVNMNFLSLKTFTISIGVCLTGVCRVCVRSVFFSFFMYYLVLSTNFVFNWLKTTIKLLENLE